MIEKVEVEVEVEVVVRVELTGTERINPLRGSGLGVTRTRRSFRSGRAKSIHFIDDRVRRARLQAQPNRPRASRPQSLYNVHDRRVP